MPTTTDAAATRSTITGTAISLRNLTKDYGTGVHAVDDVSLDIEPGEFMTFLGPSGSGKTTTLNMIAGFEQATAGTITVDGVDIGRTPPHRRNLGMVFQHYALFPHMTVEQNIAYPLRERRVPRAERVARVNDALALVNLEGRNRSYPRQLSGGQQQRVALARALVFGPRALLLDEPLGALDRKLRVKLQHEIQQIHRDVGATFLFVTHDQEEALTLSDRITLFRDGRIEQIGTPQELYNRPRSLFSAEFLGESNLFRGGVLRSRDVLEIRGERWCVAAGGISESVSEGVADPIVVVRPEKMSLARAASDVDENRNSAEASVIDVVFLGTHARVGLSFAQGGIGSARIPAELAGEYRAGDGVTAAWRPEDQWIVNDC